MRRFKMGGRRPRPDNHHHLLRQFRAGAKQMVARQAADADLVKSGGGSRLRLQAQRAGHGAGSQRPAPNQALGQFCRLLNRNRRCYLGQRYQGRSQPDSHEGHLRANIQRKICAGSLPAALARGVTHQGSQRPG